MGGFPQIKTARSLVAEDIVPCSEELLKALARRHGIGRKLGRAYVFTPDDVAALIKTLPCPSSSSDAREVHTGTSGGPSGGSALTKALALATAGKRKTSSRSAPQRSRSDPSMVIPLHGRSLKPR